MADDQGTGKHKHKSAAEPEPHHEAPSTKGAEKSQTEHKASAKGEESKGGFPGEEKKTSSKGGEDAELTSREYTGPDGAVHHHTKAYVEQHK